ncbi:MAG: hypothetical protein GY749_19840 [Desulfobacteraceae bacterium]|nr:hypothetical protein [Desulfobacteraceae bacterium]
MEPFEISNSDFTEWDSALLVQHYQMNYLIDSDVVNILYDDRRNGHEQIHRIISALEDEDRLFISVLILYELEYSFFNAPDDKKDCIRNTINCVTDMQGLCVRKDKDYEH